MRLLLGSEHSITNIRTREVIRFGWGHAADTPLIAAVLAARVDMVEFLLQKGADVNARGRYKGGPQYWTARRGTALQAARLRSDVLSQEVMAALIAHGADPSFRDAGEIIEVQSANEVEVEGEGWEFSSSGGSGRYHDQEDFQRLFDRRALLSA